MDTAGILRIIAGVGGIFVLCMVFLALARRNMKESMGVGWSFFGVLLILMGAVPGLSGWSRVIPEEAAGILVLLSGILLWVLFALSCLISQLMMKNQELAMQVSLLNQENERILYQLELLTGKKKVNL